MTRASSKHITGILLLVLALTSFQAPVWSRVQPAWVARYNAGLSRGTNEVIAMQFDPEGNVLIAGSSTSASGDYDYLVLKYGPDGSRKWVTRYASTNKGNDRVSAMAVDKNGNVYLTGTSVTAKYNTSGTLEWTAPFSGRDITLANDGSLYVTGFSDIDFATAKLDSSGSNVWVRMTDLYAVGLKDHSEKVATDEMGNVYVAGSGNWGCQFLPRPGIWLCYSGFGMASYDAEGGHRWTSPFERQISVYEVIALRAVGNHLYFCKRDSVGLLRFSLDGVEEWRYYDGIAPGRDWGATAIGTPNENATYVTGGLPIGRYYDSTFRTFKVDSTGTPLWEARYDNGATNLGPPVAVHRANAMSLHPQGSIHITGESANLKGDLDWATIKYSPDGKEQWVIREDGPAHGDDKATAMAVDGAGNVYVAGTQTKTNGLIELVLIKYSELNNIQVEPNNSVTLQFFGSPGQLYHFLASASFPAIFTNWDYLGSRVAGIDGIVRFTDTNALANAHRFYRLSRSE